MHRIDSFFMLFQFQELQDKTTLEECCMQNIPKVPDRDRLNSFLAEINVENGNKKY